MQLGERLREIRENKGITIAKLAKETALTSSLISQVERNISSPSVSTLKKIATVLDVPISSFFENDGPRDEIVVRADKRRRLMLPNSHLIYEMLSPDFARDVQLLITKLDAGAESSEEPASHGGDECLLVMGGRVKFILDKGEYILEDGDTIYIKNGIPHKAINIGDTEVVEISAIGYPGF